MVQIQKNSPSIGLSADVISCEDILNISDQTGFLRNITLGYHLGAAFFMAFHEGLLTDLISPKSSAYLSSKYGIPPEKISLILGMLVSGSILQYHNGEYQLRKELIPFLKQGSPLYAQWLEYECKNRHFWENMSYYLKRSKRRTPDCSHTYAFNKDEIISMGVQSLLGRLQGIITILMGHPRFSTARSLLDLGGGHGFFGIACAQAHPDMKVIIYDKPPVVRIAWQYVCMSGFSERIICIGGDYLQDTIGSGYDIILHICPTDFPPDVDRRVIRTVHDALSKNGLYVRCGFFLDDNCIGPLLTTSFALTAEMRGETRHRTIPEFRQILTDEGLHLVNTIDLSSYCNVPLYMLMSERVCE